MIVTILPGSENFHAIRYNDAKVSKGCARLIEKKNIYMTGDCTTEDLVKFFRLYSEQNSRIKKAQFHVAVSCKGKEMTVEQLLDFSHKWLKERGYAEPGQPLLVYSHHDTDNNHLHIVTSCVAPDGWKIDNNHERRRSQEVINPLLKNNPEEKADNDIQAAKDYTFGSLAQFKAILSSMGYQVYERE